MRLAIISDSHDNLENLSKFLNWAKEGKIQMIVHCGDVASSQTLKRILNNFEGKVFLVFGNADLEIEEMENLQDKHQNLKIFDDFGKIKIKKLKIAFTHFPETAKQLAKTKNYHFIFYGHTHKPWTEEIDGVYLANPGNLKGEPYQPIFCVLDLEKKKFELVLLNKI